MREEARERHRIVKEAYKDNFKIVLPKPSRPRSSANANKAKMVEQAQRDFRYNSSLRLTKEKQRELATALDQVYQVVDQRGAS
jgi:tetratricopeptide (TPR) repeat protein